MRYELYLESMLCIDRIGILLLSSFFFSIYDQLLGFAACILIYSVPCHVHKSIVFACFQWLALGFGVVGLALLGSQAYRQLKAHLHYKQIR